MDGDRSDGADPPVAPDDALIANLIGDAIAAMPEHAVWKDERFLQWLTDRETYARFGPVSNVSESGRRLIVRAYCRRLGIQLLQSPPPIVSMHDETELGHLAPLIGATHAAISNDLKADQGIVVPVALERFRCVACKMTPEAHVFAPFINLRDTILIALSPPDWSPAATVRRIDGRVIVTTDYAGDDLIGTLIALWSDVMR